LEIGSSPSIDPVYIESAVTTTAFLVGSVAASLLEVDRDGFEWIDDDVRLRDCCAAAVELGPFATFPIAGLR
jgi:hypothetical protein